MAKMDEHDRERFMADPADDGGVVGAEIVAEEAPADAFEESVLAELEKVRNPKNNWVQAIMILVVSLALFVGIGGKDNPIAFTLLLVAVLFVHEMGHYIGMRIFGYRNVKMFFIPLFGAAVSGQRTNAESYQEAIVTLLGPVPGLFLAIALLVAALAPGMSVEVRHQVNSAAVLLAIINCFNLLPIFPFDGGRLLNQVLFSRNRYLEAVFLVVASLALIGLGIAMKTPVFWILGIWMLLTVGATLKTSSIAERVGGQFAGQLPPMSEPVPLSVLRPIIAIAKVELPSITAPRGVANVAFRVWEKMHVRPPGALATVALLATYLAAWLLIVPMAVLLALQHVRH
jgi:Zn-dependent protease